MHFGFSNGKEKANNDADAAPETPTKDGQHVFYQLHLVVVGLCTLDWVEWQSVSQNPYTNPVKKCHETVGYSRVQNLFASLHSPAQVFS